MKRLFAFGCSFTHFNWPTWADILGNSYDHFENWGVSGIGNRGICERVSEFVLSKKLTKNDTVIIQWTDPHRFDLHFNWPAEVTRDYTNWRAAGSIFDKDKNEEHEFIIRFWNEWSYIMHTMNFIHLTYNLLKNQPSTFYMFSRTDLTKDLENFDQLSIYKDIFAIPEWISYPIQDYLDFKNYKGRKFYTLEENRLLRVASRKEYIDKHPTPVMYLEWLKAGLLKKLDIELDTTPIDHWQSVLDTMVNWYDFNSDFEKRMGWEIQKNHIKGL